MENKFSLKDDGSYEALREENKQFFHTIDMVELGEKGADKKLYKYVENGRISIEKYYELIKNYNLIRKKKTKKTICKVMYIVLLLSITIGAVIYHYNALEESYSEGETIGYRKGYDNGYANGYKYYEKIKNEYNFFHEYAVITTSSGKKYHKYNCYHIKNRSFCIYNITNAKAQGYKPCLDCYD